MNEVEKARYLELLNLDVRSDAEQKEFEAFSNLDMKREALKNQSHTRVAGINVTRKDLDNNTLSFVFISDDNGGKRFDWGTGEYYTEVLVVEGANVDRLNTFFKDHFRSVDSAVGKVSNVKVDAGQLVGDVTFGTDEDSQRVLSKYSEGILTDVSIGYEIRNYSVEEASATNEQTVSVTDFDIFEVSAVGIGFDSGAKKRSEEEIIGSSDMNKELRERLEALEAQAQRSADENAEMLSLQKQRDVEKPADNTAEMTRMREENANLKRQADVNAICDKHSIETAERAKYVGDTEMSADKLRALILDKSVTAPVSVKADVMDERNKLTDAVRDALALRLGTRQLKDVHPDAEKYRNAPLAQLANMLLPEAERSFNPVEIAERSMVTGDFPILLMSAGNRVLESEFEAQVATAQAFVKQVDVSDFRVNTDAVTGQGGRLDKTLENGDLKELTKAEHAESWKLESFGNKFVLTREMIINDDLNAFTDMLSLFAGMAVTTFNGLVYDLLTVKGDYSAYKMADGTAVYSTTVHKNKASSALDSASLSAGRLAMRNHKGIDGVTPLNIVPKYLVVAPALEQTARELMGASNKIGATNTGEINVHQNSLELIVDAELSSATEWYLLAERRTIKVGYLAGTGRKPVLKMNDSSLIRTTFEGVFDMGMVVEDYRGMYQGNQ